mgnify:CR=1 FL=1
MNIYTFPRQAGENAAAYRTRLLAGVTLTFNGRRDLKVVPNRSQFMLDGTASGPGVAFVRELAPEPVSVTITPLEFLNRLTAEERAAIRSSTSNHVQDARDYLLASSEVIVPNSQTTQFMNAVVADGLLTQERADEVLNNGN